MTKWNVHILLSKSAGDTWWEIYKFCFIFFPAQMSTKTGECPSAVFPLSSMGAVIMEVVIPPAGTEISLPGRDQTSFPEVPVTSLNNVTLCNSVTTL